MANARVYIDGRPTAVVVSALPPFYNSGDRVSSDHWPGLVLTVQDFQVSNDQCSLHLITGVVQQ